MKEEESQLGWGVSDAQQGFLPQLNVFLEVSFTVGSQADDRTIPACLQ